MRAYHLSVLGLNESATKADIKSSYRLLSKRYHPDINKSPDAHEQFIRVKEAYEYLTKKPIYEEPRIYYNEEQAARERWRKEYRRKARENAFEQQRLQRELINQLVSWFKPVAIGILIFNSLLTLDYILPFRNHEQKIKGINRVYENAGYRTSSRAVYRYDEMLFDDFTMRFDQGEVIDLDHYDKAVVEATIIFSKPMYVEITIDGKTERHKQIYNIYYVFGYLIPIMMAMGVCFFKLRRPMHKLNLSVVLFVFSVIQLILYFL
ncbi:MAG: DnaJ domain-containing protein [Cyclobacteriaceae bacterium]